MNSFAILMEGVVEPVEEVVVVVLTTRRTLRVGEGLRLRAKRGKP